MGFRRCACPPLEGVGGGITHDYLINIHFHPLLFPRLRWTLSAYSLLVNNVTYFLQHISRGRCACPPLEGVGGGNYWNQPHANLNVLFVNTSSTGFTIIKTKKLILFVILVGIYHIFVIRRKKQPCSVKSIQYLVGSSFVWICLSVFFHWLLLIF